MIQNAVAEWRAAMAAADAEPDPVLRHQQDCMHVMNPASIKHPLQYLLLGVLHVLAGAIGPYLS
eukprot:1142194-Pelagomonas_calceolata.AAC.9